MYSVEPVLHVLRLYQNIDIQVQLKTLICLHKVMGTMPIHVVLKTFTQHQAI